MFVMNIAGGFQPVGLIHPQVADFAYSGYQVYLLIPDLYIYFFSCKKKRSEVEKKI